MRVFVAIDCSPVNDELLSLQGQLAPYQGRLSADFHMTLKFLGNVDQAQYAHYTQLLAQVRGKQFDLVINRWGEFRKRKQIVMWVGPTSNDHLIKLQQKVDGALQDCFDMESQFSPHVTLARLKRRTAEQALEKLGDMPFNPIRIKVNAFYLMESVSASKGVRYVKRQRYPLE